MADSQDTRIASETTTEAPVELVEQLRAAGVANGLTSKVWECIRTERAQATAEAARLFYRSEDEPSRRFNSQTSLTPWSGVHGGLSRRSATLSKTMTTPPCPGALFSSWKTRPRKWSAWPNRSTPNVGWESSHERPFARDRSPALASRLAHQASDLGDAPRAAARRLLRMGHARGSETGAVMTYDRAAIMRDAHKRFRASSWAGRSRNASARRGRRRRSARLAPGWPHRL
jgi:hypothetical protein